ncbi:MAG: hypothetical protein AABY22_27080, partial [Nanoarchaeota archaeon]
RNTVMEKNFTNIELGLIASVLTILCKDSHETDGLRSAMNTYHFTRFSNETHYIDYHEKKKTFKVYKHYKGFTPNEEHFKR